jgi:hypothetical protein
MLRSLLSRVRGADAAIRARPVRDAFIEPDAAAGAFDARKRLELLEKLIGGSLANEASLSLDSENGIDSIGTAPRPHEFALSRKIVEELNLRESQFPGRLWEAGTPNGTAYAQEFLKSALATGDLRAASANAAKAAGFAERFEPTLDDVENALIQMGVMPAHTRRERSRGETSETAFEWLRYLAIAMCCGVLGAALLSAF